MFACQRNVEIKANRLPQCDEVSKQSHQPSYVSDFRTGQRQLALIALQVTRFNRRKLPPKIEYKAFLISLKV